MYLFSLQEEPATSSPLNSMFDISGLRNDTKSRQSMRSSEFEIFPLKYRHQDFGDDEGFFSDATMSIYYQHSRLVYVKRIGGLELGVQVSEWRSTRSDKGLKIIFSDFLENLRKYSKNEKR